MKSEKKILYIENSDGDYRRLMQNIKAKGYQEKLKIDRVRNTDEAKFILKNDMKNKNYKIIICDYLMEKNGQDDPHEIKEFLESEEFKNYQSEIKFQLICYSIIGEDLKRADLEHENNKFLNKFKGIYTKLDDEEKFFNYLINNI